MSTAKFVSYFWSPGLPEEDLDEESILSVGRDHDLFNVRVCRTLVAGNKKNTTNMAVSPAPYFSILHIEAEQRCLQFEDSEVTVMMLWWVCVCVLDSPDGHISVLGLSWLGTALQWCLGDSRHRFVHQHLLVLHPLT